MTREEAIENIKELIDTYITCHGEEDTVAVSLDNVDIEALDIAIKALEQEPCEDAISRKALLEMAKSYNTDGYDSYTPLVVDVEDIEELPSVTPIRPKGHWYIDERPESDREVICSNCEQSVFKYHKLDFDYRPKYCPNCGAEMEEVET